MDKCEARNLLKINNLKSTRQRVLLLEHIIKFHSIFTANSLIELVKDNMDTVTVYRILSTFQKAGIIRTVLGGDEIKRYELACVHNPVHPHFYCRICNKLSCLDFVNPNIINFLKESNSEIEIDEVAIQFTGICYKCKNLDNIDN